MLGNFGNKISFNFASSYSVDDDDDDDDDDECSNGCLAATSLLTIVKMGAIVEFVTNT